jgi:hypothetical protein
MTALRENEGMSHVLSSRSLSFAQTLVRMNTVSTNSNLELIDFVRDHLAGLGVRSRITRSADRRKANLFATLGAGSIADMNGLRRGTAQGRSAQQPEEPRAQEPARSHLNIRSHTQTPAARGADATVPYATIATTIRRSQLS